MDQVITFIVKTFDRPHAAINCCRSIFRQIPNATVILSDDGSMHVDLPKDLLNPKLIHQKHEFNIGLSEGRNRALDAVETPLFFLLDDDMELDRKFKLSSMHAAMDKLDLDIVGCELLQDGSIHQRRRANIKTIFTDDLEKCVIVDFDCPDLDKESKVISCDWILNCFLAKTQAVKRVGWNPRIKIGHEHGDFFYRAKRAGLRVGHTSLSIVSHRKAKRSKHYTKHRRDHKRYVPELLDSIDAAAFCHKADGFLYHRFSLDGFKFRSVDPDTRLPFPYRSAKVCVVGNSSNLLGSGIGEEIDKHDIVVRFNNYETTKYAEDVGTKTTVWATSFWEDIKQPRGRMPAFAVCPLSRDYGPQGESSRRERKAKRYSKGYGHIPFQSKDNIKELKKVNSRPSTGMAFLWWFVHESGRMPDMVCGFDFFTGSNLHYFDSAKKTNHKSQDERATFEYLVSLDKLNKSQEKHEEAD